MSLGANGPSKRELFPRSEIEQSIPQRFETIRQRFRSHLAVRSHDGVLTYDELDRRSNAVAHAILRAGGSQPGPVAVFLAQGAALVAAILGVLKAGRAYVPLDEKFPPELRRFILEDTACHLVLSDEVRRADAATELVDDLTVLALDPREEAVRGPELDVGPEDLAYIYYTSGTTGRAKGVFDCHRNVLHNVMRYTNSLEIDENDRLTLLQTPGFSGAVSSTFCGILNGATIFPFDLGRLGLGALARTIREHDITVYHSVPTIFEALLETTESFPSLRVIRLEGDTTRRRHLELYRER